MKNSLILIAVVVLGIPSLAVAELPCCDDLGPAWDTISVECCATLRLCGVPDAGYGHRPGNLLAQTPSWIPCSACTVSCWNGGNTYLAYYSRSCRDCSGGEDDIIFGPPHELFPPFAPSGLGLPASLSKEPGPETQLPDVPQKVTMATRTITSATMSPDGTVYVVGGSSIKTWTRANPNLTSVGFDFDSAVGQQAMELGQIIFHQVAFDGDDAYLFWTTKANGAFTSYLTSLSNHSTITLNRGLLAQDVALASNGEFYVLGSNLTLALGVHRFSSQGTYVGTFINTGDPERVLATASRVYVKSAANILREHNLSGQFLREYNLSEEIITGKIGAIQGLFVKDGTVYVEVVPADPGSGQCTHGWDANETTTLYRLVNGRMVEHSTGRADTLLLGITSDGEKVGRSLLVGSRSDPAVIAVDNDAP